MAKKDNRQHIYVFGSNLAGIHGAGSAAVAVSKHGAKWRVGIGRTGFAYAIPTKDYKIKTLPLKQIETYIKEFIQYAEANQNLVFDVVAVGCGLAGYKPFQIAPFFKGSPDNVNLPIGWRDIINSIN